MCDQSELQPLELLTFNLIFVFASFPRRKIHTIHYTSEKFFTLSPTEILRTVFGATSRTYASSPSVVVVVVAVGIKQNTKRKKNLWEN